MSDRLTIELIGDVELQRRLAEAVDSLARPRELMGRIGALMERNVEERFQTKQAPDATPWRPISAATRKIYERVFKGNIPGSLLLRTGHMRDSLTFSAAERHVDVGFGDPKAAWHEFGTQRMPRRQLLTDDPIAGTLGEQDREDVLAEVNGFLRELL
jgi:phage virion morphogenesis protein